MNHDVDGKLTTYSYEELTDLRRKLQKENAELKLQVAEQAKYAELGRLAVKAVFVNGFENCNSIYDKECFEGCEWLGFCQKRAELLANP